MQGALTIKAARPLTPTFLEPPNSISDQVYEYLKEKILYGDIEPGERLMQVQVAESLKASRTPVRDAFRRLEQDGLVERLPQGGVRVTSVDPETIRCVFGIRGVLEAYAVELACDSIPADKIAILKQLLRQAREVLGEELEWETKLRMLFELNTRFHETIYRASGNRYLIDIINNLRNIVRRMRYLGLRAGATWTQVWDEHGELIDHLEKRDKDSAVRLIRVHLRNAASYVSKQLTGADIHAKKTDQQL